MSSFSITAFAAPVDEATIDTSRTGSLDIYKYDLTNAEKDGVWNSSYVSTGVKDESGVETVLGDPARVCALNANGSTSDIHDGYAHTGTASSGDVLLEFFRDEGCTDLVTYNTASDGSSVMTVSMTASGLAEINSSRIVCTLRITYKATMNSDASVTYGDAGNPNDVALTWKRTNSTYYDTLVDDCHVYIYGIDMTKQFSDGRGDFSKAYYGDIRGISNEISRENDLSVIEPTCPTRNFGT